MQSKILLKITPLLIILFGLTFFAIHSFYSTSQSSSQSDLVSSAPVAQSSSSVQQIVNSDLDINTAELPIRLKIPSINIDAPVEYVGLTSDGAMDVPKSYANVGWFNLRPRPGENGTAVIAGHYGPVNNVPSVFDNLHTLREGDKVHIEDEKGKNITFVVRKTQVYNKDDDTAAVFNSGDGKARLNLITCAGVWNNTERIFSERLVVFTDKE